ncbi:MAG: hypothetical protein LBD24_01185 [Spirochaetaceae bacterium]|nr:hypothetical protein [Spirochaetaceae bacterium]
MHHSETTGGHAVPPAAGGVLHHLEATGGHTVPPALPARTGGGCRCIVEVWLLL